MNVINLLPALPGTYGLLLEVTEVVELRVGRLGMLAVQPGVYWYVGSAFGAGGVRARVGRHARQGKRLHWHVDYLREVAALTAVLLTTDPTPREHLWADAAQQSGLFSIPFLRFGASDCRCAAHLFYSPTPPDFTVWQQKMNGLCPTHASIQTITFPPPLHRVTLAKTAVVLPTLPLPPSPTAAPQTPPSSPPAPAPASPPASAPSASTAPP